MSVLSLLKDTVLFSGQTKYGGAIGFTLDRTVAWPSIISSMSASANAVTWSGDGTYFYTVEGAKVRQYGLQYVYGPIEDSAIIVETTENALDYAPTSIVISPDGTKMFLSYQGTVNAYTLTTPYKLVDFLFDEQFQLSNTNIVFNETKIKSLRFGDDGKTMYVYGGDTSSIYQINLSNSYQLSSYSNLNTQFSLTRAGPNGFTFSNSGSSFYVVSDSGWVDQYNTTIPYNTTTGNLVSSFQVTSSTLAGSGTNLGSIIVSADGTKLFIADNYNSGFWQVDLSVPYNLTSASVEANVKSSPYLYTTPMGSVLTPVDMDFDDTGTKMFVLDNYTDNVVEYALSEAYNPNTAVKANVFGVASQDTDPYGFYFGNAGYSFYLVGRTGADITQYNMTQPYNANTATFANVNFHSYHVPSSSYKSWTTSEISGDSGKITFSNDGNTLVLTGYATGANMLPVALRKPWDLSTIVNGSTPLMTVDPLRVKLSNDGKTMFVVYASNIHQYSLWVPWEPGSATYQKHFTTSSYETNLTAIEFSDDGNYMYIAGKAANSIARFSLTSPWDISSPSLVSNVYLNTVESNVGGTTGLFWKPGGESLYVLSDFRDRIYQYNLGTAWDTTTATNTYSQYVGTYSKSLDLHFAPDGYRIYLVWKAPTYGGYVAYWRSPNAWILNSPPVYKSSYNLGGNYNPTEVGLTGIDFSTDGTRIISVGTTTDHARKFYLNLPFDFNNPYHKGIKNPQANYPYGIDWSPSGNSLYIHMQGYTYNYTANVPFDFHSVNFANVRSTYIPRMHASDPRGLRAIGNYIFHTASGRYVARSEFEAPVEGQEINLNKIAGSFSRVPYGSAEGPQGLEFSPDGSNVFYVVGTTITKVPLSSPWNFKTMANASVETYGISATVDGSAESTFTGMSFVNGGSNIILSGASRRSLYDLKLSSPFTLTGASYGANSHSNISYLNGAINNIQEVKMGGSSDTMYVVSKTDKRIYTLRSPTPNSTVGVKFTNYTGSQILNLASVESVPANTAANTKGVAFDFSIEGSDLFFMPARGPDLTFANTKILQYAVASTNAWDIGSFGENGLDSPFATANVNRFGLNSANSAMRDFKVSNDGRNFLLLGADKIVQVQNLSTPQTFYNKTIYANPSSLPNYFNASYTLVAGGGGTGIGSGGGGGGGLLSGNISMNLAAANSYVIVVGAGGTGGASDPVASDGGNTIFASIVTVGGGRSISTRGYPGGSGGGAGFPVNVSGALGRPNQGTMGGNSYVGPSPASYSGGGGGAGQAGFSAGAHNSPSVPTDLASYYTSRGGDGLPISVVTPSYGGPGPSPTGRYFAGGGGGARDYINAQYTYAPGGAGGGGSGAVYSPSAPVRRVSYPGSVNTGGGAGGGYNSTYAGNTGGSGIAIIYYNSSNVHFTGGDITVHTAQTTTQVRHVFSQSGYLTVLENPVPLVEARILVVAGGGGGGTSSTYQAGGGGAGGWHVANINIAAFSGAVSNIIVGSGGTSATNGAPSKFQHFETTGGGGGSNASPSPGTNGGSAGGNGTNPNAPYILGRGNVAGLYPWEGYWGGQRDGDGAGGGGGGTAPGGNGYAFNGFRGGAGGAGVLIDWIPSTVGQATPTGQRFSGGGGGAGAVSGGAGGLGGGGRGAHDTSNWTGNVNTGGGGGGGYSAANNTGGSGVVIVRYTGNARFTGGIVESANGFTFHIFTSSNTLVAI